MPQATSKTPVIPKNPFDAYAIETKTAFIKSLNSNIKYRRLTMAESDNFNERLVSGYDNEGRAIFNSAEATKIKYEKASLMLVSPAMSVEALQALGSGALEAIAEINHLDDPEEIADTEGN